MRTGIVPIVRSFALAGALAFPASALIAAPAMAELRDVASSTDGMTGHVWLVFDTPAQSVAAALTATGLQLDIDGVTVRQRTIAPYDASLVSAVSLFPADHGARIEIDDRIGWQDARASIVDGAVLVTLVLPRAHIVIGTDGGASGATPPAERTAPGADFAPRTAPAPVAAHAAAGSDAAHADAGHAGAGGHDVSDLSDGAARAAASSGDRHAAPAGHADAPAHETEAGAAQASGPAALTPSAPHPAAPAVAQPGAHHDGAAGDAAPCAEQAATVAENPWDDDSLHAQAACLTDAGDLGAAARIYEQMLAFAPDSFRALIALAELREEQGETEAAQDLYTQAASHAMSDAEAARARSRLRALRNQ